MLILLACPRPTPPTPPQQQRGAGVETREETREKTEEEGIPHVSASSAPSLSSAATGRAAMDSFYEFADSTIEYLKLHVFPLLYQH